MDSVNDPGAGLLGDVRRYAGTAFGVRDAAEMEDFLKTFVESFRECAEALRPFAESPDPAVVRRETHKIFGFAPAVGALRLDAAARELNAAAKALDIPAMRTGIASVLSLYEETVHGE